MASSKDYLNFVLDQLSDLTDITFRQMMGEYIVYFKGKIIGGIYDDRLLVKNVPSAAAFVGEVRYEIPYEGAKPMIFIDEVDNRDYLCALVSAMYDDLTEPRK